MILFRLIAACAAVSLIATALLAVMNLVEPATPVAEPTPPTTATPRIVVEAPPTDRRTDIPPHIPPPPEPPPVPPSEEPAVVVIAQPRAPASVVTTSSCDVPGQGRHTGWVQQGRQCPGKP